MNAFQQLKEKKVLDKDGKVDALGPYGKMKLTGREVATYFRKNKVRDKEIKKAVEVALDLSGADTIARKEIKKFYGDKILKSKEVQHALKFANEETFREQLSEGKNLMPDIQKIVDTKGAKKVGGIMIDMFTASMINQIYNKVNDKNKQKMEKSNISTLVDLAQRMMQKMGDNLGEGKGTDIFKKYGKVIGRMSDKEQGEILDALYTMNSQTGKRYKEAWGKVKELLNMGDNLEEGGKSAAQQAAIAISKKEKAGKPGYDKEGKSLKKESVMDSYREMWENGYIAEEVQDITVDPKNKKFSSPADQNYHGMEIAKQARRMGLKSAVMGKHVRIKGAKKKVNDFLRVVIGKSRYGDPTNGDYTTPQIDKMLNKGMK